MSKQVEKKKAWYLKLLEDLKKLIRTESKSIIPIKHNIGKRILEEKENVPYGQIFIFIKELANKLEYSWQDLYFCTKFAEKYPDLQVFLNSFLPTVENLTWHYIREHLLYEQREKEEKEEKFVKCDVCDSTLPSEDFKTFKACSICSAEFLTWLQERKEKGERVQKQT